MLKHIIREATPEQTDFSWYFEDDGLTERGGSYFNNLFIVSSARSRGFNEKEYKRLQDEADSIIDGFSDIAKGDKYYFDSYKEVMIYNGLKYSPSACHKLKQWAEDADSSDTETMAEYLTITTGKKWDTTSARGYCQGDYVEMVYCPEYYKNGVKQYGEIWLGAGKEFCVIDLDEKGEEIDSCWGYIVADCQARKDEDYKRLVCEWAGIEPNETELQLIDDCISKKEYTYRTA